MGDVVRTLDAVFGGRLRWVVAVAGSAVICAVVVVLVWFVPRGIAEPALDGRGNIEGAAGVGEVLWGEREDAVSVLLIEETDDTSAMVGRRYGVVLFGGTVGSRDVRALLGNGKWAESGAHVDLLCRSKAEMHFVGKPEGRAGEGVSFGCWVLRGDDFIRAIYVRNSAQEVWWEIPNPS